MGSEVTGVSELTSSLAQAREDLLDMAADDQVAAAAADVLRGFIPVRTGRARSTVAVVRADGRAVVTFGGPRATYAPLIRATHPSRFVERTDQVMETRAAQIYEAGWDQIATRNGLT